MFAWSQLDNVNKQNLAFVDYSEDQAVILVSTINI